MGEIHELFVLALSLVWLAGATPDLTGFFPGFNLFLLKQRPGSIFPNPLHGRHQAHFGQLFYSVFYSFQDGVRVLFGLCFPCWSFNKVSNRTVLGQPPQPYSDKEIPFRRALRRLLS